MNNLLRSLLGKAERLVMQRLAAETTPWSCSVPSSSRVAVTTTIQMVVFPQGRRYSSQTHPLAQGSKKFSPLDVTVESNNASSRNDSPAKNHENPPPKKRKKFLPPKAAVKLTSKARKFFKLLLDNPPRPNVIGVMLNYSQASSGQPRMVFSFDFVTKDQIHDDDEGVSLEVLEDGVTPKPPKDSCEDGLPKLYIHHNGFMKVLGCTLDVDIDRMEPILYDPEGNIKDPNVT